MSVAARYFLASFAASVLLGSGYVHAQSGKTAKVGRAPGTTAGQAVVVTTTPLLDALRHVQDRTDKVVSVDNDMLGLLDTLDAGKKTLDAATAPPAKPAPELVDTIVGLSDALTAVGDGTIEKWQQDGVPGDPPVAPAPAAKASAAAKAPAKGKPSKGKPAKAPPVAKPVPPVPPARQLPQDRLLKQLNDQVQRLEKAMVALETASKDRTAPADVQSAYLACRGRLDDAIERIKKVGTKDQVARGYVAAYGVYSDVVTLSDEAKKQLGRAAANVLLDGRRAADTAAKASVLDEFKAHIEGSIGPLGYAARSGEVDKVISQPFIDGMAAVAPRLPGYRPPFPSYASKSPVLAKAAGDFLLALRDGTKDVALQYRLEANSAKDQLTALMADPRGQSIEAHTAILLFGDKGKKETDAQASLATLLGKLKLKPLSGLIPSPAPNDVAIALDELSTFANAMALDAARLSVAVTALGSDYAEDIGGWTEAEVNLYYFDDVERLLTMITPNVARQRDNSSAQAYQTSQMELLRAQEELVNSRARLADARRQLSIAMEDLRLERARVEAEKERLTQAASTAGSKSDAASEEVRQASLDAGNAKVEADAADRGVVRAQNALTRNEDATKKAALQADLAEAERQRDEAKKQLDAKQLLLAAAQEKQAAAAGSAATANSNVSALQSNVDALQTKLGDAQREEGTKTEAMRTASTNAYVNSFAANRSFAKSIDDSPYFITKRDGFADRLKSSTDPADRVLLYGEPMEKRIVIRGRADDVETVRRLISLIDRPQGQSEITVFTAEMSSPTDPKLMDRTRQALRVLDTELARYSLYNTAAQTLLAQAISAVTQSEPADSGEVRKVVEGLFRDLNEGNLPVDPALREAIPTGKDVDSAIEWVALQPKKLRTTLVCLDPRILESINLLGAIRNDTDDYLGNLPDLTSPASLAESTLTLSLLRQDLRNKVINIFENGIRERFRNIVPPQKRDSDVYGADAHPDCFDPKSYLDVFRRLPLSTRGDGADAAGPQNLVLNSMNNAPERTTDATADIRLLQDGFSYIYLSQNRPDVLRSLDTLRAKLVRRVDEVKVAYDELLRLQGKSVERRADRDTATRRGQAAAQRTKIVGLVPEIQKLQARLRDELKLLGGQLNQPIKPNVLARLNPLELAELRTLSDSTVLTEVAKPVYGDVLEWFNAYDTAVIGFRKQIQSVVYGSPDYHRNVARYNLVLRRIMGLYYTDVQNSLVNGDQGLLVNVDRIFKWSKSEVGAWNSETILASNRLAARIDPQASASAQQSSPIDATGALVLANLVTSGASNNIPGILKDLKDLSGKQREDSPAVYGIGTGNVFEVTPIVDPTGQALRFRFNYVASTRVREPGGVTDRQLNHVEQNSVNTEVVLDNLAIRRVSAFQSNVQLGLPSQKTGGLPIFKDLPVLKEVPLLGWFTYRIGGRRPVVQQSVILTQAAIYPTIEDVVSSLNVTYKNR